jgi:hypothetical protein
VACDKTNCVISLGLTIMDHCPECEKQERAAEEAERVERVRAFAARWSRDDDTNKSSSAAYHQEMARRRAEIQKSREESNSCNCDKPHEPDTSFFVSCIEDSGQRRKSLLLGPYDTHEEALANVDRGRKLAEANDPKAYWYSFGTCSIHGPTERKGVFGK